MNVHSDQKLINAVCLVYTTKLDHMCIVKTENRMNSKTILQCIENESKPQLKSLKRKRDENIDITQENTFRILRKKIRKVNSPIAEKKKSENIKLLDLCKPVRIVLNDIKKSVLYDKYCSQRNNCDDSDVHEAFTIPKSKSADYGPNTNDEGIQKPVSADYAPNTNDEEIQKAGSADYVPNTNDEEIQKPVSADYGPNTNDAEIQKPVSTGFQVSRVIVRQKLSRGSVRSKFIALSDLSSQVINIYSFNDKYSLKEYASLNIRLGHKEYKSRLAEALKVCREDVLDIQWCCWYSREKVFQGLSNYPSRTMFMRKRHECEALYCKCCCRLSHSNRGVGSVLSENSHKNPYNTKSINILIIQNFWLPDRVKYHKVLENNTQTLTPYFISNTNTTDKSKVSEGLKSGQSKGSVNVCLKQTSIKIENWYCEIGENGYLKLFTKNALDKVANINANICCWYSREKFIDRLLEVFGTSNNIPFLRTIHQCSVGTCNCCCKPAKAIKAQLKFYSISKRHTSDCVKKKLNIKIKFPTVVRSIPNTSKEKTVVLLNSRPVPPLAPLAPTANNVVVRPSLTTAPVSATTRALENLKNVRFNLKPNEPLSVDLDKPLQQCSLEHLRVVDYIFNHLEKIAFDLSFSQNNAPKVKRQTPNLLKIHENNKETKVLSLFDQFSLISSDKTKEYVRSFRSYNSALLTIDDKHTNNTNKPNNDDLNTNKILSTLLNNESVQPSPLMQSNSSNVANKESNDTDIIKVQTPKQICKLALQSVEKLI